MLKKVRNHFGQYAELFYMLYFLPLAGCVSMGISSSQPVYRLVFIIAAFFLLLKLILTDYNKKEVLLMASVMALLGYVFYRTREKALIITAISIFACKGVNIRKILKYTFFVYIIGMCITISLVLLGKIPGEIHSLPKGGIRYNINDFGFSHPNSAYGHVLMIAFMAVVVWENKLRWYHYSIMTVVMIFAYKVFFSRAGLLIYLLMCVALAVFNIVKNWKLKKAFGFLLVLLPLGTAVTSYVLAVLYPQNIPFVNKLDTLVTGRIELSAKALESVGLSWFGTVEKPWVGRYFIDNAYLNVLLGCGIIVCAVCVISYIIMCYYYWQNEQHYYVLIVLGIVSIYLFMEYAPVNVTWNPILLFMAGSLFNNRGQENLTITNESEM